MGLFESFIIEEDSLIQRVKPGAAVWAEQCDAKCGENGFDSAFFDSAFLFPIRRFSSASSRIRESIIGVVSVVGQRGWKIVHQLAKR